MAPLFDGDFGEVVGVDEFSEGREESCAFLCRKGGEVLFVVFVGDGSELWDEASACGSEGDALEAAVFAVFFAGDEVFGYEAIDEPGDGAAGESDDFGEDAGRGFGLVEHLAKDDPFGYGDSTGEELTGEGVRDVVGDEAQPEAGVAFEVAEGWGFGRHGASFDDSILVY